MDSATLEFDAALVLFSLNDNHVFNLISHPDVGYLDPTVDNTHTHTQCDKKKVFGISVFLQLSGCPENIAKYYMGYQNAKIVIFPQKSLTFYRKSFEKTCLKIATLPYRLLIQVSFN